MDEELKKDIIDSMEWLVADARWRSDQCKGNLDNGSKGGYSPELTKAIETLAKLKGKWYGI